jgi:hypothetical protein
MNKQEREKLIIAKVIEFMEFEYMGILDRRESCKLVVPLFIESEAYQSIPQVDQPDPKPEWISVEDELERAKAKHPDFPIDMFRQLAIMQEEAGEVTKAVLHYHYEGGTLDHVREELIQTAAMCMRMLQNLPTPPKKG